MSTAATIPVRTSSPHRTLAARLPDALFALLLLAHVLPVWVLARFPTQDGPLHVENVLALLRLDHVEVLRQHLVANWGLQPNWLTQVLFGALTTVASPRLAERLVLTGYLVLLPLSLRYALPRSRRGRWAALAIFPFLHGYAFHMGFWNFSYGLALVLAVLGTWRRARRRPGIANVATLALLLLLAYFCHPVAVAASLVALACDVGWRAGLAIRGARGRPQRLRRVLRAHLARAAALVPAVAIAAALMVGFVERHGGHATVRVPALELAGKLVSLYALVSVDRREILLSLPVALAIIAGVTGRLLRRRGSRRALRPADGWLLAAGAFTLLYFLVPDVASAGAQISDRLALFPYLFLVVWLGTTAGPARDVRRVAVVLAILALAALALRFPRWHGLSHDLEEYASVSAQVPRGAVILPLTVAPYGLAPDGGRRSWRVRVFQHAAGWIAAERDALDLDDSQAGTDHCPVRLAPGPNPFRVLGVGPGLEGEPPCVDLDAWHGAGGRVDAVIVFGAAAATDGCSRVSLAAVRERFERVGVSSPRGLVEVYRARPVAPPGPTASR